MLYQSEIALTSETAGARRFVGAHVSTTGIVYAFGDMSTGGAGVLRLDPSDNSTTTPLPPGYVPVNYGGTWNPDRTTRGPDDLVYLTTAYGAAGADDLLIFNMASGAWSRQTGIIPTNSNELTNALLYHDGKLFFWPTGANLRIFDVTDWSYTDVAQIGTSDNYVHAAHVGLDGFIHLIRWDPSDGAGGNYYHETVDPADGAVLNTEDLTIVLPFAANGGSAAQSDGTEIDFALGGNESGYLEWNGTSYDLQRITNDATTDYFNVGMAWSDRFYAWGQLAPYDGTAYRVIQGSEGAGLGVTLHSYEVPTRPWGRASAVVGSDVYVFLGTDDDGPATALKLTGVSGGSTEAVWEFAEADWTACVTNEAVWEFSEAEWSTCQDVVEVEPTPYYPSPPTVQDSGVSALRRLDIGYYQVGVYSRGGEYRLTMLPRVTKISFGRSLDDTSSATVTCVSEEWADLIHPWQHEIHIFRNNILVWCGPVRDKAYDPETGEIVIDVRDLFAWMDFRTPHSEIDLVETDVADVFVALMESALAADPSPNILIDKTAVGSTIDFYYDPETPKIVAEDLRQMAEAGVDYTTFLRTVIIRGEYLDKAPIGTLLRSHLSKVPIIKESGEMATQLYLTGSGADVHAHPDAPLTAAQWDLHPYGLLEQVHDADKLFDSDDVSAIEKAGRSRYELVKDPRLFISDMRLAPSAPVEMNDLIPGRRIDVKLDVGAIPMISMYRLQGLQVEVDGTSETVTLEVTSLGDYDKDTPI
jgi:hypothetical protein